MAESSLHLQRFHAVCRSLALAGAFAATTSIAHANVYDEAVDGDLSNDPAAPTNIGLLTPGISRISGTTVPSGTFEPATHSYSIVDDDYATFTVPTGYVVAKVFLDTDSVIQPGDRLFMGIAQGSTVSVDPAFTSAAGLLGWTLVSQSMVGSDLLPYLGASAPTNFPPIPGATGFDGPLGSGPYSLWLVDGDHPVVFDLHLNLVPAVPEPTRWAMMLAGIALTGLALRRRVRSKARSAVGRT